MNETLAISTFTTMLLFGRKHFERRSLLALKQVNTELRRAVHKEGFRPEYLVDDLLFHHYFWRGIPKSIQQQFLALFPGCNKDATTMHEALAYAIVSDNKEAKTTLLKFQTEFFSYLLGSLVYCPERVARLDHVCHKISLTSKDLNNLDEDEKNIFLFLTSELKDLSEEVFLACVPNLRNSGKYKDEVCDALQESIEHTFAFRQGDFSQKSIRVYRNLIGANLEWAYLKGANLMSANLMRVDLAHAMLEDANFQGTCLVEAKLRAAKLGRANLSRAMLCKVDLHGADLEEADFSGAELKRTELLVADFAGANFMANITDCKIFYDDSSTYQRLSNGSLGFNHSRDPHRMWRDRCNSNTLDRLWSAVNKNVFFVTPLIFSINATALDNLRRLEWQIKRLWMACLGSVKIGSLEEFEDLWNMVCTQLRGATNTYPKAVELLVKKFVELCKTPNVPLDHKTFFRLVDVLNKEIDSVRGYFDKSWKTLEAELSQLVESISETMKNFEDSIASASLHKNG